MKLINRNYAQRRARMVLPQRMEFFDFGPRGADEYRILYRASLYSGRNPGVTDEMTLTLAMLRCPDNVAPETRTVSGGEFSIGRGPENDWVLADPERGLSKRHCVIGFQAGGWQVADCSTNGTFLNREGEPVGRGQTCDLRDGDRLRLGAYEIEIHIEPARQAQRPAAPSDPFAQRRSTAPPEMFALDPFGAPPGRPSGPFAPDPQFGEGAGEDLFPSGLGPASMSLPADYDPLAPDPLAPDPAGREFRGPVQSDHTPHIQDAFSPPPARSVLPEDWDREINQQMPAPAYAATAEPRPPATPLRATRTAAVPAPVFLEPAEAAEPVRPARTPTIATATATAASPVTATSPVASQANNDLLAAFLRGAGVVGLRPADPEAAMESLGAAFRAVVAGLRQAMIARAAIKGEFRIEQTMIRSRGNNPLKFSADDEDALAALIGIGRHSDMDAVAAVSDALRDIRLHELATVAAMQSAVRALLAELDPARLRQTAERALRLMTGQRKADAWDAFEALHGRITQALTDDFDSVFGKSFARSYERAIGDISAKETGAP
jgi:type VI secretion system protein ImpI/type VI secretion system protein